MRIPTFSKSKTREWKSGNTPDTGTLARGSYFEDEFNQVYDNAKYLFDKLQNNFKDLVGQAGIIGGGEVTYDSDESIISVTALTGYDSEGNRIESQGESRELSNGSYKLAIRHKLEEKQESGVTYIADSYELVERTGELEDGDVYLADVDATDTQNIAIKDKRYIIKSYVKDSPDIEDKHSEFQRNIPPSRIPMPFLPGYFNTGNYSIPANVTFTLDWPGTNTVASINTYLKTQGYENWRVCDGTAPNDPDSPYFNTPNKYLPDLTDRRFIMGLSESGEIGGQNISKINKHFHHFVLSTEEGGTHSHHYSDVYRTGATGADDHDDHPGGYGVKALKTTLNKTTENSGYHVHRVTGTIGSGGQSGDRDYTMENRPKYLACFYIMRIK